MGVESYWENLKVIMEIRIRMIMAHVGGFWGLEQIRTRAGSPFISVQFYKYLICAAHWARYWGTVVRQ